MGRRLEGFLDAMKLSYVSQEEIKGDTRSRYYAHQLFETNEKYRQGFTIGAFSVKISELGIMGVVVTAGFAEVLDLIKYFSK